MAGSGEEVVSMGTIDRIKDTGKGKGRGQIGCTMGQQDVLGE